jgi:hypothetical protein
MTFKEVGWKIASAILVVAMLVLPGCATLGNGNDPNQTALDYFNRYQAIMRLGVQVGVLSVLEPNPTYATRIVAFADYVQEYLEGQELLDLQSLEDVVRDKVDWTKYNPTERALVEALIIQIRVEIENVLKANKTQLPTPPEEVKMVVSTLVTWIGEAANIFIQQQQNRSVIPVLPPRS